MKKLRPISCLIVIVLALSSCARHHEEQYKIGVSQCSEDIWRDKQNAELRMGAYFHGRVAMKFAAAYDSDERQVQQIDSLVASGIDLLIVAPNQVQTISPAIDRAYDRGIPVIVFERKTSSRKYTAFISADNYEMGRTMGEYIVARLGGRGRVLEVKGLEGSSPAIERHKGFMDAMNNAPDVQVVASLQGDWTEASSVEATKEWLRAHPGVSVDYVFGHNDRMAMGARRVLAPHFPEARFCGIDGLPGPDGGIQLVRDSLLDASYIYPTHGDRIIDLAVRILEGEPYQKETLLMSALVTRDNAKVLLMQSQELMRQADQLDQLHHQADGYLHELDTQRLVIWMALGLIVLLVVVMVLFYLYHLRKTALQRERVVSTLWNMDPGNTEPTEKTEDTEVEETAREPLAESSSQSLFVARFKEVVEARLSDSGLTVDDLAADMNLSRVHLYRKVKAVTGSSPVELLRTARLGRAYQMLLTTDMSVSEVAYAVGFTAPSYFTKCFKEEFGKVPGDVRKG